MKNRTDFERGMKFLADSAKRKDIPLIQYQWIPEFSEKLSERNSCFRFWRGVVGQDRLDRLPTVNSVYDIMYKTRCNLMCWMETTERHQYWSVILEDLRKDMPWCFNNRNETAKKPSW